MTVAGCSSASGGFRIPLKRPLPAMSDALRERHGRTMTVTGIGPEGQARLLASRVLVVGVGGLGSPVLQYLAAAGVGRLGIADVDRVEPSNLPRQVIHGEASVGDWKVDSAARRIAELSSGTDVVSLGWVTASVLDRVGDDFDLVVDCTDTFAAKYLVGDWCARSGHPLVWGTVASMQWQVSDLWTRCPEPTLVRCLRDLHPGPPPDGAVPTAGQLGVLGPVVGQCGSTMAAEAVKLITGAGRPLLGEVLVGDAARNRYETLAFSRRSS